MWVAACYFFLFVLSGTDAAVLATLREFLSARDGIQHMQQLNRRFDHGYVGSQLSIDFVVCGRQGARSLACTSKGDAEFFERALFVPEGQDNGLYFWAPRRFGKIYASGVMPTSSPVAGTVRAVLTSARRRYLVFVVPVRTTATTTLQAFANCWLTRAWMVGAVQRMVFDLRARAKTSCVGLRLRTARALWARDIPCPIEADDENSSHH
ncbi:MAG: hypothetical protein ACLUQW_09695 [Collinsella sp.]